VCLFQNFFKNVQVIMLEMWMSKSYAWGNPMGSDHNLHGEAGRQNRKLLCQILLFFRGKGIKIVLMSMTAKKESDYKHPLSELVDEVFRHPCNSVAPQSAAISTTRPQARPSRHRRQVPPPLH
jgi:hypothetical protein